MDIDYKHQIPTLPLQRESLLYDIDVAKVEAAAAIAERLEVIAGVLLGIQRRISNRS